MDEATNRGPLLGYHLRPDVNVVDDGPVDYAWAKRQLDEIIRRNQNGAVEIADSVFGLFREGDLNAFEVFILGPGAAEVIWDYRYGPNRFWILERVSYNRRSVTDFAFLYSTLELYCANGFRALRTVFDSHKKPRDFRSSFKS